jgi:hypothetical protein
MTNRKQFSVTEEIVFTTIFFLLMAAGLYGFALLEGWAER